MTEHARMFIDRAWVDSQSGAVSEAHSPSTGDAIGTVPEGTRAG